MKKVVAVYGNYINKKESALEILGKELKKDIDQVSIFDYRTIKRKGIGEYLNLQLNENNVLRNELGKYVKDYHVYVEVMLRMAQAYYDEKVCLCTELDGKGIILINDSTDKTVATSLALLIKVYPEKNVEEILEWLEKVSHFRIKPDISVCLDLTSDVKRVDANIEDGFYYMAKHDSNIIMAKDENVEKIKDIILNKIVSNENN